VRVRSIKASEIDMFASIASTNPSGDCQKNLLKLWQDGLSRPEWCFVLEDSDECVGRIVYWVFPNAPWDIKMMGLELPWGQAGFLDLGKQLMNQSIEMMRDYGAKHLECRIYSDYTEDVSERLRLFDSLDVPLVQQKVGLLLEKEASRAGDNRLEYLSLAEVSEDEFILAIERVMEGTLDRDDSLSISERGVLEVAKRMFLSLKDIDYDRSRWLLAYYNREIVGLVVPQVFNHTEGAINFIGILPKHRGKGYVLDVLAKGLEVLFAEGLKTVLADVDTENIPMLHALEQMGFKRDYGLWVYQKNL